MFHYSLVPSGNQTRLLIAVFLAITVHMGLMNFKLTPKEFHVPDVSIPHSVSIYMGQQKRSEASAQPPEKIQSTERLTDESPAADSKLGSLSPHSESVINKKTERIRHQSVTPEKPVKQYPHANKTQSRSVEVEETKSKEQELNNESAAGNTEPLDTILVQQDDIQEAAGARLPGTLQTAYPRYQLNDPPVYPGLARKREQEGSVLLRVLVNEEGRVADLEIENSSGFGLLDRAAVAAVRVWIFEPGRRGDQTISMWVRVPVTFQLE